MLSLYQLSGPSRRRCMRIVRRVKTGEIKFARGEPFFRDVERLHRAGLITAAISRSSWLTPDRCH